MARTRWFVALCVLVAAACTGDRDPGASPTEASPASDANPDTSTEPSGPTSSAADEETGNRPASRVVADLRHVANSEFALGSVWAVTSSRPDRFSSDELDGSVVQIDPTSGRTETVFDTPGVEPDLVAAGDRLWVADADRLVALDGDGTRVAEVPITLGRFGGLAAANGLVWASVTSDDVVVGIDSASAEVVHTIETGRFPVRPVTAFGYVWVTNLNDGTITIIDVAAEAEPLVVVTEFVSDGLKFLSPVPGASTGDEMWITNIDGELFAMSARPDRLGQVRQLEVPRPINTVVAHGDTAVLLPTWGKLVLAYDLDDDVVVAEIDIDSIPFRGLAADEMIWVTGDGNQEIVSAIDPDSLAVRGQFAVGGNESDTTGPQQPLSVGDEIWIPNRGASAFFIIDPRDL